MTQRLHIKQGKNLLILFSAVLLCMAMIPGREKKDGPVIIGYVGGYRGLLKVEDIAAKKLTHINYAFVNVKDSKAFLASEKTDTVNLRNLYKLKKQNPDLQLLISIGGWSWSENFSDAALTDSTRQIFAKTAVDIIRKYQLDGVDIDWEYPGMQGEQGNIYRAEDKQNFTLMLQALRTELDKFQNEAKSKKLLTIAVGGFSDFLNHTEMRKAQQYLDFINLMTYDFYSSTIAGHNANLYPSQKAAGQNSGDNAFKAFSAAGVPANKLVLGVPFYSRTFTVKGSKADGIGDTILSRNYGKGFTYIKENMINQNGFTAYLDTAAKAPYLFNALTKEFITYDDEQAIAEKCTYIKANKMGGVMFWEYSNDEKGYLLDQINKSLR